MKPQRFGKVAVVPVALLDAVERLAKAARTPPPGFDAEGLWLTEETTDAVAELVRAWEEARRG